MNNLSVVVITFNEEDNLPRCLKSVELLNPKEVIVVDSGSTDRTADIADEFEAKIYDRKFDNFASQKNYAAQKATGEWIFSIDADEIISKELADEINLALENDQFDGYLIPRRNFILGSEIKYSRWSPDKHIWLWRKNRGKWEGEVHEEVVVEGKVGELKNPKVHYQDQTILSFFNSNVKYAKLLAQQIIKERGRFSIFHLFYDPIFEFLVRFVYKKGFLDGWRGLVLALLMAYYRFDVWINVLKLQK
jgi:glycosyltransferase involved in cell wall biosynthesis